MIDPPAKPASRLRDVILDGGLIATAVLSLFASAASAETLPTGVGTEVMTILSDRALIDTVKYVRSGGATAFQAVIKQKYLQADNQHNQLAAIYALSLDYYQTMLTVGALPNVHDPFYNLSSFGTRVEKIMRVIEADPRLQETALKAILLTNSGEMKKLGLDGVSALVEAID